jgi:thioredoxin reductase (NADPH)
MDSALDLYGALWCPACRRVKKFLQEQRVPFTWHDIEQEPGASEHIAALNNGTRSIPTLVLAGGEVVIAPANDVLADRLGINRQALRTVYDVIIIGGGPAGLTTSIYAARENLRVLVLDQGGLGGQAGVTERFENYPGFPDGIGGADLADRITEQARRYGVELVSAVGVEVVVHAATGDVYRAGAVLIATGSAYRRLNAPGEAELIGAGIHFCATCDGPFYKDADDVLVIGGGNSGLEEGLFLTQFARKVTVVEFGDALAGSRLLQEKVLAHPQMEVHVGTQVTAFHGEGGKLAAVTLRDRASGAETHRTVAGAFVFIGLDPNTAFLGGAVDLDERGFVVTSDGMATSLAGVFAAGDVRAGSTKQIASAVGEGAAAAIAIRRYLDQRPSTTMASSSPGQAGTVAAIA